MKKTLMDYFRAAFNARPIGMLVPPNWIGIGLFALLGIVNPGFWIMGLGVELAYLYYLGTHPRFQRLVNAADVTESRQRWQVRLNESIAQLSQEDRQRYQALERRCRTILDQQRNLESSASLLTQGEGLGRLVWIYLRLLLTRQSICRVLRGSESDTERVSLEKRIETLNQKIKDPSLTEDVRKSLTGQLEILQQRLARQREARDKLAFLEAELTRIQEQVELVREQAVVTTSPEAVSQNIDQISATLGGTTQWIREQQEIYGSVEDLLAEPPPIIVQPALKEVQ